MIIKAAQLLCISIWDIPGYSPALAFADAAGRVEGRQLLQFKPCENL